VGGDFLASPRGKRQEFPGVGEKGIALKSKKKESSKHGMAHNLATMCWAKGAQVWEGGSLVTKKDTIVHVSRGAMREINLIKQKRSHRGRPARTTVGTSSSKGIPSREKKPRPHQRLGVFEEKKQNADDKKQRGSHKVVKKNKRER